MIKDIAETFQKHFIKTKRVMPKLVGVSEYRIRHTIPCNLAITRWYNP